MNEQRAFWLAEACIAEMRASIDGVLTSSSAITLPATWRTLDASVRAWNPTIERGCQVSLKSVGSAIDINAADYEMLRKHFTYLDPSIADAATDALLDWRDGDDDPRNLGAERAWYVANTLSPPRNDSIASILELSLVRGFDARPNLADYLTVESSRVCLTTAPAPVLAALPGFTPDAVTQVLNDRVNNVWFGDLDVLRARLPRAAAESILVHYTALAAATTVEPEGWILSATGTAGQPTITATSEIRLAMLGKRAVIVRRIQ